MNIGILSTASIATRSVIPAMLALPEQYSVFGIASRTLEKAIEAANKFNCKAYDGYEALLADESIEAVYIPLPTGLHFEWVSKALKAGKHVLCEKSLGCNLSETSQMVSLAEKHNLALVENFQFRFHSQLATLLEILNSNTLGEIRSIRTSFGFPPFPDADNIRYKKNLGGGALLDAGAYMMKIVSTLLGDQVKVSSAILNFDARKGVDIHGSGFLVDEQTGIGAHIAFGFDHFYQCGLEVWCSKGRLRTNRLFTARADYTPVFEIETADGMNMMELQKDDHFQKMLLHFHAVCKSEDDELRKVEYSQNTYQATLLEQFKNISNG